MNSRLIALILSGLASVALLIGGGYLIIDDLIQPKGFLFEGIVISALGLLLGLMITIALSIGQTILIFGQIMEQQVKIQQEMREMSSKTMGGGLSSILKGIIPPGASISITDLETGKTTGDVPAIDLDVIKNLMRGGKAFGIEEMGLEELEKELAKAVKADDYERAAKINQAIKDLKDSDQDKKDE